MKCSAPTGELTSTSEMPKSIEQAVDATLAENTRGGEIVADCKTRSKLRTVTIVFALFVRQQSHNCYIYILLNTLAVIVHRCSRRNYSSDCGPHNIPRFEFCSRLYLDRRCLLTELFYVWANMGQTIRYLGKKDHHPANTCGFLC